jgi:hypothetical protein
MADRSRSRPGRPQDRSPATPTAQDQVERALEALEAAASAILSAEEADAEEGPETVDVHLTLSLTAERGGGDRSERARTILDDLRAQVVRGLEATGTWRPGTVYAFQSKHGEGPHARPPQAQDTFAGYSAHGQPQWISLLNLCIARGDSRVDRLYAERPEIIAIAQTGDELTDGLLPGFGRADARFAVLGQVVAGLVPRGLDPRRTEQERVALTLQVVDVQTDSRGHRLRLNLLGMSGEEIADAAARAPARGPAEGLRRTIAETRHRIDAIDRQRSRLAGTPGEAHVLAQIPTLLTQLRGDVERVFRQVTRRTQHAQDRHAQGERPTSQAQQDLAAASDDRLLLDRKRHTFIVLGPRNRAHVFSPDGRHVTSIRVTPGELSRKTDRSRWITLDPSRIADFRNRAMSQQIEEDTSTA